MRVAHALSAIVELDRRRIGSGEPGHITRQLIESFRAVVAGRSPRHEAWLTRVEGLVSASGLAAEAAVGAGSGPRQR